MRRLIIAVAAASLMAACAAPMTRKMQGLSLGMTKAEAIAVMGKPVSVSATNGIEYLNYRLSTSFMDTDGSDTSDYFVKIVNGRVEAYGQKGDFDTTAKPKERIEVEVINKDGDAKK